MDGTFVDKLTYHVNKPLSLGGRTFAPTGWTEVGVHRASPLAVATLGSLVGYVKDNRDKHNAVDDLIVHVADPVVVHVCSRLGSETEQYRRHTFLTAKVATTPFAFGAFLDVEAFIIAAQTLFVPGADVARLIELVASITEKDVVDTLDDGYAQRVTVQQGVAFIGERKIQNPVSLAPWRTFANVKQPLSPFIVRLQSGAKDGQKPKVALYEADGGKWRLDAVEAVAEYLRSELPDGVSVIA